FLLRRALRFLRPRWLRELIAEPCGPLLILDRRMAASSTISFARGAPSADLLPVEDVRAGATAALDSDSTRALSYGTGIGHPGLCEWIGERHGGVDPARGMVTNGSLGAGWVVVRTLPRTGD